jgi:hypothetical protein
MAPTEILLLPSSSGVLMLLQFDVILVGSSSFVDAK